MIVSSAGFVKILTKLIMYTAVHRWIPFNYTVFRHIEASYLGNGGYNPPEWRIV
jgi:hypothetical protein